MKATLERLAVRLLTTLVEKVIDELGKRLEEKEKRDKWADEVHAAIEESE